MEEYVAKSTLKKELNIANLHSGIIDALQNIVDEIPAADVQEVKHGKWLDCGSVWDGDDEYQVWRCSECIIPNYKKSRYCPNCGALMDGKDNKE